MQNQTHEALPGALWVLVSSEQNERKRVTKPKTPAPKLVCQPASCVLDWEFPSFFWEVEKEREKKKKREWETSLK